MEDNKGNRFRGRGQAAYEKKSMLRPPLFLTMHSLNDDLNATMTYSYNFESAFAHRSQI